MPQRTLFLVPVRRVLAVALAAVAIPTFVLQALLLLFNQSYEFDWYFLGTAAVVLICVVAPLALLFARRAAQRLGTIIIVWFFVGLLLSAGWKLGSVGMYWIAGNIEYPRAELLGPVRPWFLGDAVSDALGLAAIGAAIWAGAFWKPAESKLTWIRDLYAAQSGAWIGVMRVMAALGFYAIFAALVEIVSSIIYRLALA